MNCVVVNYVCMSNFRPCHSPLAYLQTAVCDVEKDTKLLLKCCVVMVFIYGYL